MLDNDFFRYLRWKHVLMPTPYELEVRDATTAALASDADLLSEFGKTVESVYLLDESPYTKVVVQVHEVNASVGDVRWAKSYAIYDGSWDTVAPPRKGVIAGLISTEIVESTFAGP